MDGACIQKQLADALPFQGWSIAEIDPKPNGKLVNLELRNGADAVLLTVEEGNFELGAFFTDAHARYYFNNTENLEMDAGLHAVVGNISKNIENCFQTENNKTTEQYESAVPGIFDFYLPLLLSAVVLISLAPPLLINRFNIPLRSLLKKTLINTALLCCGTTMAFAFAEMLVRVSQTNPAEPDLASENGRYHMIPRGENELHLPPDYYKVENVNGESFWYTGTRFGAELGRRGSPPELEKGSELRVLAVGDSILFGSGVAEKDTFLRRAETLFREKHPEAGAEFVNLSQPGWNFAQYKIALKRWIGEIKPRLVLLAFWSGDIKNVIVRDGYVVRADILRSESALLSPQIPLRLEEQRLLSDKSRFFALLFSVLADRCGEKRKDSDVKKLRADYEEILQIVRHSGAKAVFMLLPRLDIPFAEQGKAPGLEVYRLLEDWIAHENDVILLDPTRHLDDSGKNQTALRRDHCHFNETGHEIMSEYLVGELEKMLILSEK